MVWGYKYVLTSEVYRWAKPGFILTAAFFAVVGVPVYLFDGVEAGHMISIPLALIDIGLVIAGSILTANKHETS